MPHASTSTSARRRGGLSTAPLASVSVGQAVRVVVAVAGCVCVWLMLQLHSLTHSHNHTLSHSLYPEATGSVTVATEACVSVDLLLQVSPVRAARQISRLAAIDTGYASWTRTPIVQKRKRTGLGMRRAVRVIAAVHNTTRVANRNMNSNNIFNFKNIEIVTTRGNNPFYKLIDAFVGMMSKDFVSEWIVMANDHSFFIPMNLIRFLEPMKSLSSGMFYGGNRLALVYHKKLISFASGGAGAVFSTVSVKALLVLWSILHRDYTQEVLTTTCLSRGFLSMPNFFDVMDEVHVYEIDLSVGGRGWLIGMQDLLSIFNTNPSKVSIIEVRAS
jgi:hypothetical protein